MLLKSRIPVFPLREMTAKTGTRRAESPRTNVSRKTIGDCLSNFFTTLFRMYRPIRDAIAHQTPIQRPKGTFRVPKTM